jgi:hypothetical protein
LEDLDLGLPSLPNEMEKGDKAAAPNRAERFRNSLRFVMIFNYFVPAKMQAQK